MIAITTLYLMICIIGLVTFIQRVIFLYYLPDIMSNDLIRRGMDAVPASMLVALVVPFTLFVDQQFIFWRAEVLAIFLSIPLILYSKKYGYGILFASLLYYVLKLVLF